jgi:hypothetical protein
MELLLHFLHLVRIEWTNRIEIDVVLCLAQLAFQNQLLIFFLMYESLVILYIFILSSDQRLLLLHSLSQILFLFGYQLKLAVKVPSLRDHFLLVFTEFHVIVLDLLGGVNCLLSHSFGLSPFHDFLVRKLGHF